MVSRTARMHTQITQTHPSTRNIHTAILVLTSMIPAVFLWQHEGAMTTFAVIVVITSIWWGGKSYVKMFTKYERVINGLLDHGHIEPSNEPFYDEAVLP